MEGDIGSYAWFFGIGLGLVALGGALACGAISWRRTRLSARMKAEQQHKVDEMYHRDRPHASPQTRAR